jgi:CheY-like chemotaxis protein
MLQARESPRLAVLDWMMPSLDGVEICRRLRRAEGGEFFYMILLTTKNRQEEIVEGLEAGADDYLTKPYNPHELRLRVRAGERILRLQSALKTKVDELQEALEEVKQLQGLLPICMHCKSVRDQNNVWHRIDAYIARHTDVRFSHGLCRTCLEKYYPDLKDETGHHSALS